VEQAQPAAHVTRGMPVGRGRRIGLDPGLGAVLLLAILAAWPFLSRPGLPVFTDTEQHVYRTYEILAAWRAGVPFIRWAPDLYHGFGYPVFQYYAPLSYYLGAAYGWAFGDGGPVAGVKFVYVAAAALGATGMYLFLRETWDSLAGLVGAAAFVLSPYLAAIEPHQLGHAPESLAIALAPLTFWAFERLRLRPTRAGVALAAVCLAAGLLAHNLMPLIFSALLVAWLAWCLLVEPDAPAASGSTRSVTAGFLTAGLMLGAGLAACFWLPAVFERGAVQLSNAIGGPYLDYRNNFVPLSELLAPLVRGDTLNPHVLVFKLGLPQWVLAALGGLAIVFDRGRRRGWLFWVLAAGGLLFFVLPASRPIWEAVPALALLQFPWRLLGPLAFVVAVLAGAASHWAKRLARARHASRGGLAWAALALAACVVASLPLLNPLPWPDFGPVTARRVLQAELDWEAGTTASNEFLPRGVVVPPGAQSALLASYDTGLVDKVNRATLPVGTAVDILTHGPDHDTFAVTGSNAFTFRLFTFDFPGWTAYVDGRAVPIVDSQPEGWITFEVPAGQHAVGVRLEDTPARQVAGWLTAATALALAGLAAWPTRELKPGSAGQRSWLTWRPAGVMAAVVLIGVGLNAASPSAFWWQPVAGGGTGTTPGGGIPGAAPGMPVQDLEGNVGLLGYDLSRPAARPGEEVTLTLHWTAVGRVGDNLRVFVHFVGPDGQLWGQSDKFHPGEFVDLPTGRWPTGYTLDDVHQVRLETNAPAGVYQVFAGLWNGYSGIRMHLLNAQGAPTSADGILLSSTFQVRS
jgi:hypothetical protein